MKKIPMQLITSLFCVAGAVFSSQLWANQVGSLGTLLGPGATDVYQVTCFTSATAPSQKPTHQLSFSIRSDTVNGAVMSVQALKYTSAGYAYSTNTSDPISGDGIFSPAALLTNGPDGDQVYNVTINHTAKFSAAYSLSYQCQDASGVQTGAKIQIMQNQ